MFLTITFKIACFIKPKKVVFAVNQHSLHLFGLVCVCTKLPLNNEIGDSLVNQSVKASSGIQSKILT
jgi:hypothetical protein